MPSSPARPRRSSSARRAALPSSSPRPAAAAGGTDPPPLPPAGRRAGASTRSGRPPRPYGPGNRGLEYATAAGHAGARRSADGRGRSSPARSAGTLPRHGAPRRRRAHHLLVPRHASTSWSGSACARATRSGTTRRHRSTSARGAATPTSTRRRCSAAGRRRCTWCPFDEPPGDGARRRAQRDRPADRRRRRARSTARAAAAGAVGALAARRRSQLAATVGALRRSLHLPGGVRRQLPSPSWPAWQRARRAADRPCTAAGRAGAAADRAPRRRARRRPRLRQRRAPRSTRCAPARSATRRADVRAVQLRRRPGARPHRRGSRRSRPSDLRRAGDTQADLRGHGRPARRPGRGGRGRRARRARSTWSPTPRAGWWSAWR